MKNFLFINKLEILDGNMLGHVSILETLWLETYLAGTFWLETVSPMLSFLETLWPDTFWSHTFWVGFEHTIYAMHIVTNNI